jgi:hypothetical protein
MISYLISYTKLWYHAWYHSLAFLALLWYWKFTMISYMISCFFYDIIYDIIKTRNIQPFLRYKTYDIAMISYQYHIISYMISRTYDISCTYQTFLPMIWLYIDPDIKNLWYHSPMISSYFSDIMAPARRDGAGWGRHGPGAPPLALQEFQVEIRWHRGWPGGIAGPIDWMVG